MSIDEIKLIEAIRAHECLYNSTIFEYKHIPSKQAAWLDIASILKRPVLDCRTKWNQMRNAYLHALNRRKSSKIFKKWKYENEMSYLLPYMGCSRTSDTVSSPYNESNYKDDDSSGFKNYDEHSNGEHTPDRIKLEDDNQEDLSQIIQKKRPCIRVGEGMINIFQTTENILPSRQQDTVKDEINTFDTIQTSEAMSPRCQEDAREEEINLCHTIQTQKLDFHEEMFHIIKEKIQKNKVGKNEIDLLFESLAKVVKQLPKIEQVKVKMGVTKIVYEAQMRCESQ